MSSRVATILVPQMTVNETDAQIVSVCVTEGQAVRVGDIVCVLETAKGVFEVVAEAAGFVSELAVHVGDRVTLGFPICSLVASLDAVKVGAAPTEPNAAPGEIAGLRITGPALVRARSLGLDLRSLPTDRIVTTDMVERAAGTRQAVALSTNEIVIFGAGRHAAMLIDLVRQLSSYRLIGIVDDHVPCGQRVLDVEVIAGGDDLSKLRAQGVAFAVNAVGATALSVRARVSGRLQDVGFVLPALVHPRATVEPSAELAAGAQVLATAYVGSCVVVERDAIINTSAVVSHDCRIGANAHVAPGALLAGEVTVGAGTTIGMGVKIAGGVHIGSDVRIGNGAIVNGNVPDRAIVRTVADWPGSGSRRGDSRAMPQ